MNANTSSDPAVGDSTERYIAPMLRAESNGAVCVRVAAQFVSLSIRIQTRL
jgi:hypothetical protein